MNYKESKKELKKLETENPGMFRMAISHLMDVGIRHLDDETIEETCNEIMQEDDSKSFMSNEFKCTLIKTAGRIAKINHIHILIYIKEEIHYDKGN